MNLLIEVKFDSVSEHLPNDSDKLVGAVPESIIVCSVFCHLFVVVSFDVALFFTTL